MRLIQTLFAEKRAMCMWSDLQLAALNVVLYRIKPYTAQLCYCIAMMI